MIEIEIFGTIQLQRWLSKKELIFKSKKELKVKAVEFGEGGEGGIEEGRGSSRRGGWQGGEGAFGRVETTNAELTRVMKKEEIDRGDEIHWGQFDHFHS